MEDARRAAPEGREQGRERLRERVARWFVAWGPLALVAAVLALLWALAIDPREMGGGSPCTGPLGYVIGIGLRVFGFVVSAGFAWSAGLHFVAGRRYLTAGRTRLMSVACWWDANFWVVCALVVGGALGPLGIALPLLLAAVHVRAALLFHDGRGADAPMTFARSSKRVA